MHECNNNNILSAACDRVAVLDKDELIRF